ncbi:MAG: hypothetical protein MJ066_06270 [Clostridia bacterium]|nr:hypothetical protein [Clostridia bacterium]
MVVVDYVALAIAVASLLIGVIAGFGKQLKALTSGFTGFIISVVIWYFLSGVLLNVPFVENLLNQFNGVLAGSDNVIVKLLISVRIDLVVYLIVLFIIVSILKTIIVAILKKTVEAENVVMIVINKVLGVVIAFAIFALIVLIAFQVFYWISGTDSFIYGYVKGSFFKLDYVYENNPIAKFINLLQI